MIPYFQIYTVEKSENASLETLSVFYIYHWILPFDECAKSFGPFQNYLGLPKIVEWGLWVKYFKPW